MCSGYATFYQSRIAPYFIHGGCSMRTFARMRERIIPKACGVVAEIGFGSGLNLPYYDPTKVGRLIGIDPDPAMLGIARKRLVDFRRPIELIEGRAENLPLANGSADTAVVTYALCTILTLRARFARSAASSSRAAACCSSSMNGPPNRGVAAGRSD